MTKLHKFGLGLVAFICGTCLWFIVSAITFDQIIGNSTALKTSLQKSGIYSAMSDSIVEQQQISGSNGENLAKIPEIQAAIRTAFPAKFIQTSIEQIIDGTYHWLNGTTPKPDFAVNVQAAKQSLADNFANYIRTRYQSLPLCPKRTVPKSTDPLTVECRVAGVSIEPSINDFINSTVNSKDFLPIPVLTADNMQVSASEKPVTINFSKYSYIPKLFQWEKRMVYILSAITAICAISIVLLADTKLNGTFRVAKLLIGTSFSLVISGAFAWYLAGKSILKDAGASNPLQQATLKLSQEIGRQTARIMFTFAIGCFIAGLLIFGFAKWYQKTHKLPATVK